MLNPCQKLKSSNLVIVGPETLQGAGFGVSGEGLGFKVSFAFIGARL